MKKQADELDHWRSCQTVGVVTSGRVCLGPCFVFSVGLSAKSTGPSTANIYDGAGSAETKRIGLVAVQSTADFRCYPVPIYFSRGLYVGLGSHVDDFQIQYMPLPE